MKELSHTLNQSTFEGLYKDLKMTTANWSRFNTKMQHHFAVYWDHYDLFYKKRLEQEMIASTHSDPLIFRALNQLLQKVSFENKMRI